MFFNKATTRLLILTIITLVLLVVLLTYRETNPNLHFPHSNVRPTSDFTKNFRRPVGTNSLIGIDPLLDDYPGPPGKLWAPGERELANATLLSLVRNSEVDDLVNSMLDLERTFNAQFNYPWTFLNNEEFDEEFKRKTREATKANITYEVIPASDWDIPSFINPDLMDASSDLLSSQEVQYARLKSYHQMCRWNSGRFFHHPALLKYKYYWRVEPKVHFYCTLPYDPFHFLADRNLTYGFVINLYDSPQTLPSLWPTVQSFLATHPHAVHPNSAINWLTDATARPEHNRNASGYSTCHFWSNFEIADMDFFRTDLYTAFFDHLDRAGGFFYERWGDAPVHSIALGLFEDKKKIHWFRDIGYEHAPYFNCPFDGGKGRCSGCEPGVFSHGLDVLEEDCRANWFDMVGMD